MEIRILILVILSNCSLIIYGQKENSITSETMEFYCTDWLFEFPDTIQVYTEYDSIPKLTKYSVIKKNENKYYDLLCWTGESALETPTQLNERLIIKFKENFMTLKLGKSKIHYIINKSKGQIILIKRE